ncbi:MAG TPA: thioredoxin family protein [Rhizobacter sp.]
MSIANSLQHPIVTRDRWVAERKALLAREKEMSRLSDQLARDRQKLPWVLVDKPYVFDTPTGKRTLADLFEGRRQLIVQHFMLAPGWEEGCSGCSFMADHVDGALPHLAARDLSFVAVSRAPLAEIERFRSRMGWQFPWVSSFGSSFNYDFHVSFTEAERARGEVFYNYGMSAFPHEEAPGVSAFIRDDEGQVFHTYSTYGRGVELMMGAYELIDIAPKGRDEAGLSHGMDWVRHHDRYETEKKTGSACGCDHP